MEIRTDLWNGELVTAKTGGDPAALRREADLLKELEHPGVVSLAALEDGEEGPRLLTRYAGRHSLSTWQPRRTEDLLAVFEALAAALAYLHGENLFHLNVCSDHVLIGASQQPLLCSFSSARKTEKSGVSSDLAAKDIAALGKTLLKVIDGAPQTLRRHNKRLFERIRGVAKAAAEGRVRSAPNLEGQLRSLAGRETSTQSSPNEVEDVAAPRARPKSSRPEETEHYRSSGHATPGAARGRLKNLRPVKRRSLLKTAGILMGLFALAFMTLQLLKRDDPPNAITDETGGYVPYVEPEPSREEAAATTQPLNAAAAEHSTPQDEQCRPVSPGYLDVTGDGCAERVTVGAGFVSINDDPFPVGSPNDQLLVGDWNCDGVATLALAEASGKVYVFDSWPEDEPLAPTLVEELAPPLRIKKTPNGTCDRLEAVHGQGTWELPTFSPALGLER